jgi:hypothetical protein
MPTVGFKKKYFNFLMDDFIIHQKNNKMGYAPKGAKNDLVIFCEPILQGASKTHWVV